MNLENQGFKKISLEEQADISGGAGPGLLAALGAGANLISSTLTSLTNIGLNIHAAVQKQQIIDLVKKYRKGEIEFMKDGQMKIKWEEDKVQPQAQTSPQTLVVF